MLYNAFESSTIQVQVRATGGQFLPQYFVCLRTALMPHAK